MEKNTIEAIADKEHKIIGWDGSICAPILADLKTNQGVMDVLVRLVPLDEEKVKRALKRKAEKGFKAAREFRIEMAGRSSPNNWVQLDEKSGAGYAHDRNGTQYLKVWLNHVAIKGGRVNFNAFAYDHEHDGTVANISDIGHGEMRREEAGRGSQPQQSAGFY